MTGANENSAGFPGSLRTFLNSGLGLVENRVELFAVELQEEKWRLFRLLISEAALASLGTVALTLVTFTLVIVFWETARLPVLLALSSVYLAGTAFLHQRIHRQLQAGFRPFSSTLDEIKKDRSCLDAKN